jgi:dUTPase
LIQFTITDELRKALNTAKLDPADYKPAYGGESVGLDLYNAGPDLSIESVYKLCGADILWLGLSDGAFTTIIPTGVKVALPPYHTALVLQRGSVRKTPLIHRAGVVDPGYTDEIFVPVLNFSTESYLIKSGQKLPFQIVCMPVVSQYCFIEPSVYDDTTRHAIRKDASFGSSDVVKPVKKAKLTEPSEEILVADESGRLLPSEHGYT